VRTTSSFALVAVLLALAAACGGKQQATPPPATIGNEQRAEAPAPRPDEDCDAIGRKVEADARAKMPKGDLPPEAKKQMDELVARMIGLVVTSCKEDHWSAEAIHCGLAASDPDVECDSMLSVEQKQKLQDRLMKAMGAFDASTPAASNSGLAECDAYAAAMEKYMACDKVPQSARDAARQGLDAMRQGWAAMGQMPDDAKQAAGDACKQAIDALEQGAEAMGCSL